ncbi:AI-2E family transporter [Geodermatophilus ruber]|nr:AI-2E family transporter [Geodermatophilus ruber]
MAEPEVEIRRTLPLWLTVVLGVAGTAVALWGIRAAAPILGPVVLAFVLTVTVHPLVGALVRRGMRRGLAVAVAVLVVNGGLIAFALALIVSVGRLATVLPEYSDEWQHMLDGLRSALAGAGIGRQQVEQALHSVQLGTVLSALVSVLSRTALAVGALALVLATVVFMAVDATGMPERLAEVPGTSRLRAALDDFARNTRRYLVTTTVFGFAVAVVDTIALVVLGIPLALLWGLLSFLTNYVPNIGFFLGLAPPTILALLVGGPGTAVLVVVIYVVVNFVLQSVLQPLVVGDVVGLSVTLTFLSVIVWTVVLGPLGAVLAIPLTLLVVAVLVAQDPDRRWARTLLAGASGADRAGKRPAREGRRRDRARRSVPTPRLAPGDAAVPAGAPAQEVREQPDAEDGA